MQTPGHQNIDCARLRATLNGSSSRDKCERVRSIAVPTQRRCSASNIPCNRLPDAAGYCYQPDTACTVQPSMNGTALRPSSPRKWGSITANIMDSRLHRNDKIASIGLKAAPSSIDDAYNFSSTASAALTVAALGSVSIARWVMTPSSSTMT